ncbi:hypothetical protein [Streptomyces sp. NPDC050485]|uniref:hypothetical protein n=1 Tax=Streptomyces sp. NPDC050485 TaxID=3365617 RepID=UPI00378F264B
MTADLPYVTHLAPSHPARPQPGRANNEEADHSESAVLAAYLSHLAAKGHRVLRHRVVTDPELASTDLFDVTAGELVMACHRTHYLALIAALGVLFDCERFFPQPRRVLLLTATPGEAARDLLSHYKVTAVWPKGDAFVRADPAPGESGP